jgi:hypothetical protein
MVVTLRPQMADPKLFRLGCPDNAHSRRHFLVRSDYAVQLWAVSDLTLASAHRTFRQHPIADNWFQTKIDRDDRTSYLESSVPVYGLAIDF